MTRLDDEVGAIGRQQRLDQVGPAAVAWAVNDRHTELWAVNDELAFPLERGGAPGRYVATTCLSR